MADSVNDPPQINARFHGYLPVVVDVETGGVDCERDALLEVAAVFLDMESDGTIVSVESDTNHILPFEGARLQKDAMAIHNIDPYHPFRLAKSEEDVLTSFFSIVAAHVKKAGCRRAVLVGHNANFDLSFIQAASRRCGIKESPFHAFTCFDTATLSALHYGKTVLAKALEKAGIAFNTKEAHSALYDAQVTAELFCKIVNEHGHPGSS